MYGVDAPIALTPPTDPHTTHTPRWVPFLFPFTSGRGLRLGLGLLWTLRVSESPCLSSRGWVLLPRRPLARSSGGPFASVMGPWVHISIIPSSFHLPTQALLSRDFSSEISTLFLGGSPPFPTGLPLPTSFPFWEGVPVGAHHHWIWQALYYLDHFQLNLPRNSRGTWASRHFLVSPWMLPKFILGT